MKNKGGRPSKKDSINLDTLKFLCSKGFTDEEIAKTLGVCRATISNYKSDPKFLDTLKDGKAQYDDKIERSLAERAMGYTHPEEKVFCNNGEIVTYETTKHYPPDPTSMIFWLKNRRPEQWRDKTNVEVSGDISLSEKMERAEKRIKNGISKGKTEVSGD